MLAFAKRSAAALFLVFSGISSSYAGLIVDVNGQPLLPLPPKKMGQCEAIFVPDPTSRALQTFDQNRNEFPAAAKIEEKPLPRIIIADQISIYSAAEVAAAAANPNLSKELKATYDTMIAKGPLRYVVKPTSLDVLDPLYEQFPNFKPVLDHIKKSLALAMASGQPVHFSPIILLGDPGLGKTHFAKALAQVLGTGFEFVSMSDMTAGWVLSGASSQWKDARMGKIAKALIEKDSANPVFVLDEIDKASESGTYNPLNPLYTVWEPNTSNLFKDEFLEVPIDTSGIMWIATANRMGPIPGPLLNRAIVFKIEMPTEKQMPAVIANIMKGELARFPKMKFSNRISDEVFKKISKYTPRDVRKLIEDGLGNAVINNRRELEPQDINPAILKASDARNPIGFLH